MLAHSKLVKFLVLKEELVLEFHSRIKAYAFQVGLELVVLVQKLIDVLLFNTDLTLSFVKLIFQVLHLSLMLLLELIQLFFLLGA